MVAFHMSRSALRGLLDEIVGLDPNGWHLSMQWPPVLRTFLCSFTGRQSPTSGFLSFSVGARPLPSGARDWTIGFIDVATQNVGSFLAGRHYHDRHEQDQLSADDDEKLLHQFIVFSQIAMREYVLSLCN